MSRVEILQTAGGHGVGVLIIQAPAHIDREAHRATDQGRGFERDVGGDRVLGVAVSSILGTWLQPRSNWRVETSYKSETYSNGARSSDAQRNENNFVLRKHLRF